MRYSDLLKSPIWQRKRLEILSRDEFTCQLCRSTTETLHVHHKMYERGKKPWEYDDCLLETLCEDCHALQTHIDKRFSFEDCTSLDGVIKSENDNGFTSIGYMTSYKYVERVEILVIQDSSKNIVGAFEVNSILGFVDKFKSKSEDGQDTNN